MGASNPDLRRVGRIAAGVLLAVVAAAGARPCATPSCRSMSRRPRPTSTTRTTAWCSSACASRRVTCRSTPTKRARPGLNFDNSEWQLTGDVRILVPDGSLVIDEATVTFRNNEILRAVIVGKPASFEQKLRKSQQLARGRASTITYDVKASTVQPERRRVAHRRPEPDRGRHADLRHRPAARRREPRCHDARWRQDHDQPGKTATKPRPRPDPSSTQDPQPPRQDPAP